jgi:hypothetical protein
MSQHLIFTTKMDFPSGDWVYNDLNNFDTAPLLIKGEVTLEVYTQLRPDPRPFPGRHRRNRTAGD